MEGIALGVGGVLVALTAILMVRWQIAAGAFPTFDLRDLFGPSRDERAERRRRQFLLSIVPVVVWGWVIVAVSN